MSPWARAALGLIVLAFVVAPDAHAEKRVALLIGNQAYSPEIGKLANPHNDIALLEKVLQGLRFEVKSVRDAGLATLHQAVNAHARRVKAAGPDAVGFFYYAGHGAADGGINYLIPVDVKSAEEGDLWDVSLRLTEVTRKLKAEAGNATHFVVFDACRNNLKLRQAGSRALVQSRGFVPVAQESGMLVAYATAEGELASDIGAGAGPYARVLAEEIVKPGVEAVTMFRNVQRRVRAAIKQEPYLGFNALGDVYLAGLMPEPVKAMPAPPPPQAPTAPAQLSDAAEAWAVTERAASAPAYEAFLRRFGDTFYGDLAKVRLAELKQAAEAEKKRAEDGLRTKAAEAERLRLAMLQEQEKKRIEAEAARKRAEAAEAAKPGRVFRDCPDCPEMVVVPPGNFLMGSPGNEEGRADNEGPQRKTSLPRPFAVGRFEVTFAEWDACTMAGGCSHKPGDQGWGRGRRPVLDVSWNDIVEQYLPWLSRKTGKTYGLLTEAQWEYAARAGTTTPFSTGSTIITDQANFDGIFTYGKSARGVHRKKTVNVGLFRPNALGLYDMHGNVWEWVQDCYEEGYAPSPSDGSSVPHVPGCDHVARGGSWGNMPQFLRSAKRDRHPATTRLNNLGFRVARALEP